MTFKLWLDGSVGNYPAQGVPGVPTEWFVVGHIDLPAGRVSVTDYWQCYIDDGFSSVSTDAPPGRYIVTVRGMAFGDHRRVGAVRVTLVESTSAHRGAAIGEVGVDSWGVVIGGVETWQAEMRDEDVERLNESNFGKYVDGCEMVTWAMADREATFATAFTGLGDGSYPVIELNDATGRRVGIECEFIPTGPQVGPRPVEVS